MSHMSSVYFLDIEGVVLHGKSTEVRQNTLNTFYPPTPNQLIETCSDNIDSSIRFTLF